MDLPAIIAAELAGLACEYAFYCRRKGEEPVQLQNRELFSAAGIIRLPMLLAWASLERTQRANRDEICELNLEPQVAGGISPLLRTRRLPFADVLLLMGALSDKLCTNVVMQRIGAARLDSIFSGPLGLRDTALSRKTVDKSGPGVGHEAQISARDCVRLYRVRDELAADERRWIEPILRANPAGCLWLRDLPPGPVSIAHVTSAADGVVHSWAYTEQLDLFLLTQKVKDYAAAYQAFGRIGGRLLG
jgi:hypothetical protein